MPVKPGYTVVRRGKVTHAMLLLDPAGKTMCGTASTPMVVASTKSEVNCEDCAAMIVDLIRASRRRRR